MPVNMVAPVPSAEQPPPNRTITTADSWEEVRQLGIIEFLDNDPRPSIIIDLNAVDFDKALWGQVYANAAYKKGTPQDRMLRLDGQAGDVFSSNDCDLLRWMFGPLQSISEAAPTIASGPWHLSRVTIRGRWRIVQGVLGGKREENVTAAPGGATPASIPKAIWQSNPANPASYKLKADLLPSDMTRSASAPGSVNDKEASGPGKAQPNPVDSLDHIAHLRQVDWSRSVLGAPSTWPRWMQQLVSTIMVEPDPVLIVWRERSLIYNEAVIPFFGRKHPAVLGMDAASGFEEMWPAVEVLFGEVKKTGKPRRVDTMPVPLMRNGIMEETFWTFSLVPLFDPAGQIEAVLDRFTEDTSRVLTSRRLQQLTQLSERTTGATDLPDLCGKIMEVMDSFGSDTPFALLYSIEDERGQTPSYDPEQGVDGRKLLCKVQGSVGIEDGLLQSLRQFELADVNHDIASLATRALAGNKPLVVSSKEDTLPKTLRIAVQDRGHGDQVTHVVFSPIRSAGTGEKAIGMFVKALNPRLPVGPDYLNFIQLMSRRLCQLFSSVFLPAEERRYRAEVAASALEQANLAQALMVRTKEAEDNAAAFGRLASHAPLGMYMYSPEGSPIFINDYYFELVGLDREGFGKFAWLESVHPDDRASSMNHWRKLYEEHKPVTFEYRMNKRYVTTDRNGSEVAGQAWAMTSNFPQTDDDGKVTNIIGWVIDISSQKFALELQKERLKDALESRAQAHRFIDMVSHECRNPLSAILQSADGILSTIGGVEKDSIDAAAIKEGIDTIADSAQTIVLCAQHQKRIVDDILTVSKLDGNHLVITPDRVDPIALAQHVLRMYEAELEADEIYADVQVLPPYKQLEIDYVLLDPSRTLQILINLVTNAIKFTARQRKRSITITVNASLDRPADGPNGTSLVPQLTSHFSPTSSHPDWATDKDVYISFSVQDTGRGMSAEEMEKLFERFTQASPRTHVKYGGWGLGLFISRQLAELQGGQIGVSSRLGHGSTFVFYILARRSAPDLHKAAQTPLSTPCPTSDGSVSGASPAYPFPQMPAGTGTQGPPDMSTFTTAMPPPPPAKALIKQHGGLHVLIVEDNLINQKVMAKQLRKLGCTVHVANHGVEALDFLKRSTFAVFPAHTRGSEDAPLDVILMDIEMPVMDGMTCVREIRGMERRGELNKHVPVIAVTANARDAQQSDALGQGMVSSVHYCSLVLDEETEEHMLTRWIGSSGDKAVPDTGVDTQDGKFGLEQLASRELRTESRHPVVVFSSDYGPREAFSVMIFESSGWQNECFTLNVLEWHDNQDIMDRHEE